MRKMHEGRLTLNDLARNRLISVTAGRINHARGQARNPEEQRRYSLLK